MGRLVAGKTRVDIVLVPSVTILAGGLAGKFVGPYISGFVTWLGHVINTATVLHPIPMGNSGFHIHGNDTYCPISSAALAISMQMSGLAAGAATVGCSTQMIGLQ